MQTTASDKTLLAAVVVLGFSAIVTQTILVREFLSVFSGNELVIGVVLANWMILTGFGSWLGHFAEKVRNRSDFLTGLFILLAILPPITAFALSWVHRAFFPPGS